MLKKIRDQKWRCNGLLGIHHPNRHVCVEKQSAVKRRDAIGGKEEEPAVIVVS